MFRHASKNMAMEIVSKRIFLLFIIMIQNQEYIFNRNRKKVIIVFVNYITLPNALAKTFPNSS